MGLENLKLVIEKLMSNLKMENYLWILEMFIQKQKEKELNNKNVEAQEIN